jgi:hypothetical protein
MSISKKNGQHKQIPTPPPMNLTRADDFNSYYCNYAQVGFTALDVSMTIGEAVGGVQVSVEERARVFFSPAQAKIVAEIFAYVVKQYEQKFGEIVVPEAAMPKFPPL